jgi:hypothetical protein
MDTLVYKKTIIRQETPLQNVNKMLPNLKGGDGMKLPEYGYYTRCAVFVMDLLRGLGHVMVGHATQVGVEEGVDVFT